MLPFLSMGLAFIYECLPALAVDLIGAISISINWLGAQYGFADSIAQHLQRLIVQGPVLPTFGAILSHSSANSFVHRVAQHFSLSVTLFLTVALLFSVYHLWRTLPEQRDRVRRDLPR